MEEKLEPFVRHGTEENRIEVSAEEILDAIAEGRDVDVECASIRGYLDIRKIKHSELIIGGDIRIALSSLSNAYFDSTSFRGDVFFNGSFFSGYASFSEVSFGRASFHSAIFYGETWFTKARFSDNVSFSEASFYADASFGEISFSNLYFNTATFDSNVYFDGSSFRGFANFRETRFYAKASFKEVDFNNVYFDSASFSSDVSFSSANFRKGVDLNKAELAKLSPESLDSIGWAYRKSSVSGAGFFFEQAGERYSDREKCFEASKSFRNAKVEYEKEGDYDKAGPMYVREKESTRLYLRSQKSKPMKRTWFWIWKYTSNYGESPWRFIGWVAAIVLIFALIYMPIISAWSGWWPSITFKEYPFHQWSDGVINGFAYNIVTALYFSAVTFATLGFGDIAPVNIQGKVCAIAEVLLGYLMFGVLITLVARKMTRS